MLKSLDYEGFDVKMGGSIYLPMDIQGEEGVAPCQLQSSKQGWSVCEIFGCCRSDDEEDYDQNGEQSHQDIDYEYGSGIELDVGDFRHPKHNISNDSSLSLVCQTTQSDETFNRYPVGFLSK